MTESTTVQAKQLINCMPLPGTVSIHHAARRHRSECTKLLFNSIYIVAVQVKEDRMGDHSRCTFPNGT